VSEVAPFRCEVCESPWPRFKLDGRAVCEWCFHNPVTTRKRLTPGRRVEPDEKKGEE
jgi:hypothetical protein